MTTWNHRDSEPTGDGPVHHTPHNDSILETLLGVLNEDQLQEIISKVPSFQSKSNDDEFTEWLDYADDLHDKFPDPDAIAEVVAIYAESGGHVVGATRFTKAMTINFTKVTHKGQCAAMRCKEASVEDHEIEGRLLGLCARHLDECRRTGQISGANTSAAASRQPELPGTERIIETTAVPVVDPSEVSTEVEAAKADLAQIVDFKIETQDDMDMAAAILGESKARHKKLEERLQEITKPMRAAEKSVRDLFRPALEALLEIEKLVKRQIANFELEKEKKNQAALQAAADARAAGNLTDAADALSKVVHVENAKGVSTRPVWKFKITNDDLVPASLKSVDETKVRAYVGLFGGKKPDAVPGIEWIEDVTVVARTQA